LAISLMAEETAMHPLVTALENQLIGRADIPSEIRAQALSDAQRIVMQEVVPSYQRFVVALTNLEARASEVPGVWQLPSGEAYYAAVLQFYSGRSVSAQEVHNEGLVLVDHLSDRLNAALIANGLVEGTTGERLAILSSQAEQLFSNDNEGRRALIDELRGKIAIMETRIGDIIDPVPSTSVSIAPRHAGVARLHAAYPPLS